MSKAVLYTDGACKGNPGPAGIGFVVLNAEGQEVAAVGRSIGHATNNIAEYTALLEGLDECAKLGYSEVEVVSDSELMVRQLCGRYKVKNPALQALFDQVKSRAAAFDKIAYRHVLRGENSRADGLASGAVRR